MSTLSTADSPLPEDTPRVAPPYSLAQLVGYMLRLGSIGFGGPVALVGYMRRDLVERRHWISESDYKAGLTLAQLMPGPLAAQLAIYLGYVHYSVLGATVAGVAFVLPSFLMVVGLGWAYCEYGQLTWITSVFYGVGAAVIGIIAISAYKLTTKTIGRDWLLWIIFLVSAAVTVITESEYVLLFLVAGLVSWLVKAPPTGWWRSTRTNAIFPLIFAATGVPVADGDTLLKLGLFFTKAGAFVFGSGLAIIPFLHSGAVKEFHWLTEQQFLDAVAVAMITPGPVVIVAGFIGFLVGGVIGAVIAAVATFVPCYFFTIFPAPYFRKHGQRPGIAAFINGVTAAAIGAISAAVLVLGRKTLFDASGTPDLFKFAVFAATVALLWRFKKLPEPLIVVAAALLGLLCYAPLHPPVP